MSKKALQVLKKDPLLKKVLETTTIAENQSSGDVYFDLIKSIVSQQLSVKAAATIHARFLNLFESAYPEPEWVLRLAMEDLRAVGLSRQKGSYIQNVATFFQEEQLRERDWSGYADEEIIEFLTQIKGIGRWTVEMILMFSLERPDVFPVGDFGIRQAMVRVYEVKTEGKTLKKDLTAIAEPWRPYRTLACHHLWRWKDA